MFKKNVDLGAPLKISPWRKVAIGTWRRPGDPSVYGFMDIDVSKTLEWIETKRKQTGVRITLSHVMTKAIAITLHKHRAINCILRFGKIYPRKSVDIFVQVATDTQGDDLSGTVIREANTKTVLQIAQETEAKVLSIKTKQDKSYSQMKSTIGLIPGLFVGWMIDLTSFLLYTLNLWSPLVGTPRDSFGSAMITNIGSLGLDEALAPIVPYSKVPLLIVMSKAGPKPVVKDGALAIAQILTIGVTVDHRLIDGMHASHMAKTLKTVFEQPELLDQI